MGVVFLSSIRTGFYVLVVRLLIDVEALLILLQLSPAARSAADARSLAHRSACFNDVSARVAARQALRRRGPRCWEPLADSTRDVRMARVGIVRYGYLPSIGWPRCSTRSTNISSGPYVARSCRFVRESRPCATSYGSRTVGRTRHDGRAGNRALRLRRRLSPSTLRRGRARADQRANAVHPLAGDVSRMDQLGG